VNNTSSGSVNQIGFILGVSDVETTLPDNWLGYVFIQTYLPLGKSGSDCTPCCL